MTVNARSTMLCYKYAANQMIAQGRGGRIIGAEISYPSPAACINFEDLQGRVRQRAKKVV